MSESDLDDAEDREAPEGLAQETRSPLLRLADEARRHLEAFFQPFGLTGQQHAVLRILGEASEPFATMEMAARMLGETPGLTGILDRRQAKGLVRRRRSRSDCRVWLWPPPSAAWAPPSPTASDAPGSPDALPE